MMTVCVETQLHEIKWKRVLHFRHSRWGLISTVYIQVAMGYYKKYFSQMTATQGFHGLKLQSA